MKFTLTYDGLLPSTTQSNSRTKEKWEIRKALDPQLRELWSTSKILLSAERNRRLPSTTPYGPLETHHSLDGKVKVQRIGVDLPSHPERMDLCEPIKIGNRTFLPLVRDSFALTCGLKIKFLRKEEPGRLIQGGDMDNRLKTLFDALSVPNEDQMRVIKDDPSIADPIYCLVEDDRLITGLDVDTQKLLSRPDASQNEVRLIIEVDVRVVDARSYNYIFLGD